MDNIFSGGGAFGHNGFMANAIPLSMGQGLVEPPATPEEAAPPLNLPENPVDWTISDLNAWRYGLGTSPGIAAVEACARVVGTPEGFFDTLEHKTQRPSSSELPPEYVLELAGITAEEASHIQALQVCLLGGVPEDDTMPTDGGEVPGDGLSTLEVAGIAGAGVGGVALVLALTGAI